MKDWNDNGTDSDKRVKNVLKGFMSKYEIEEITIINDRENTVVYSGKTENFIHPVESMKEYAEEIKNDYVHRAINHNNVKLFIFI